jgi:hypothetical protein
MLPVRVPHSLRLVLALASGLALVAVAGWPAPAEASITGHRTAVPSHTRAVWYRGYRFDVPRSWPVIRVARHPSTCVRFDLHAVYLGPPGANENCPSWLLGATEAVLIQPASSSSPRASVEDPVADSVTATAPRISLTATFDTDPTVIYQILASAGLAAPMIVVPDPAQPAAPAFAAAGQADSAAAYSVSASPDVAAPDLIFQASAPVLPSNVANRVGLGFDVCAAPSAAFMRAWRRSSPYRAVGIYIGGSDRACDQRNLTAGWVRREAAAGWRFLPMYAGPQASFGQLRSPSRQGKAAATDAVLQAERLGFGPLTPLYYDMEAYPAKYTGAALRFMSAWTRELHRLGYHSGIYSSSDSGTADLVKVYHRHRFAMPDVIYDALWNGSRNVADKVYRRDDWPGRRRVHQYSGDVLQTFGGDTMDIDQDYLDLALTSPGGTSQASPGAVEADGVACLFYEGTDHRLWEESRSRRGTWTRSDLGGYLSSAPSVVQLGSANLAVFYRSRSGHLTAVRRVAGRWGRARRLAMMGTIGGAPEAVAQTNGVIDVFWSGRHDRHLWHGEFNPGHGWSGPQQLRGSLASGPYPVETGAGVVEVFWKGTDGRLWRVVRRVGAAWTRPQDLRMGPLGGAPRAIARPNGEIDIFWRGFSRPHAVWAAVVTAGGLVRGPKDLGGQVSGRPWPVFAAGAERVFFAGPRSDMWVLRLFGSRWGHGVRAARIGHLTSGPFAASGGSNAPLELFWRGAGDRLWSARYAGPGGWQRLIDLGGKVR